jgi:hypothetical protein
MRIHFGSLLTLPQEFHQAHVLRLPSVFLPISFSLPSTQYGIEILRLQDLDAFKQRICPSMRKIRAHAFAYKL